MSRTWVVDVYSDSDDRPILPQMKLSALATVE